MTGRGWLLFGMMSVIWGIPYLLIKVAVDGVAPPVVVFARTAIGALVLLPLALSGERRRGLRAVRRHWRALVAFAALEILGPWWLLPDAERELSSSLTGLLVAAVPILAIVLGRLFGSAEHISPGRWAGLALGLGGVALLAVPGMEGGGTWPITEVLLTAVGYAAAPLVAARWLRDVPTMPLTAACLTLAAVLYAPAAAATWPARPPSGQVLAALVTLGVLCTAIGFLVFFALIREVGASRAMVFTYVNPGVALVAGVVLLGEPLGGTVLAGFALVLAGSFLATLADRRPDRRVSWRARQTSRAGGRVEVDDLAEERPGSTGQGGG